MKNKLIYSIGLIGSVALLSSCTKTNFTLDKVDAENAMVSQNENPPASLPPAEVPVVPAPPAPEVPYDCTQNPLIGLGTEENPYQINIPCDFTLIKKAPSAHWKVMKDIDFKTSTEDGTFFMVSNFSGHFDGNDKKLENFAVSCKNSSCNGKTQIGLFQSVSRASLKRIKMKNFNVNIPKTFRLSFVAGLIAQSQFSEISQIEVSGEINVAGDVNADGIFGVGALIGSDWYGTYDQISATLKLSGEASPYAVGAMGGHACNSKISNVSASGDIKNTWMAGGVIGGCGNGQIKNEMSNSFFTGSVNYQTTLLNGKVNKGWGECVFTLGLGDTYNPSSIFTVKDSFWIGMSNCAETQASSKNLSQIDELVVNFDPMIWNIQPGQMPKLKWMN